MNTETKTNETQTDLCESGATMLRDATKSPVAIEEHRRSQVDLADQLVDLGYLVETTVYRERRTYEITASGRGRVGN